MLWGIQYIVCMCIIIDTILILEMIVWVPRVYLGVGSDNSLSMGRGYNYLLFSSRHTETSVHDLLYRVFRFWLLNISAILFRVWLLLW